MKTFLNILAGILIFGGGMFADYLVRRYCYKPIVKLVPVQAPIPSAREIQQRLKDLNDPRYDPGKIDGVIGIDTRSQRVWDNLIKDRYAIEAVEGR